MSDFERVSAWLHLGLFLLTGISTFVAVRQARKAAKASVAADDARELAVGAQQSAVSALEEANTIARDARDIVAASEARKVEVNDVHWEPTWVSGEGEWRLYNRGDDPALKVKVRVRALGDLRTEKADTVDGGGHIVFEFRPYKGQGGFPEIEWEVAWVTQLGTPRSAGGDWP